MKATMMKATKMKATKQIILANSARKLVIAKGEEYTIKGCTVTAASGEKFKVSLAARHKLVPRVALAAMDEKSAKAYFTQNENEIAGNIEEMLGQADSIDAINLSFVSAKLIKCVVKSPYFQMAMEIGPKKSKIVSITPSGQFKKSIDWYATIGTLDIASKASCNKIANFSGENPLDVDYFENAVDALVEIHEVASEISIEELFAM